MGNELALGVEIAVARDRTSVVVAGHGKDGRVVVRLEAYLDGANTAAAIAELIGRYPRRAVLATILDPRSPSATLLEPLRALRVDVTEASFHVVASAHGTFIDLLKTGGLTIEPHPALTAAAQHAMTRPLAGSEALERKKPKVDTSPIVAAELATWGVLNIEPQRPPRIHIYQATEDGGDDEEGSGRGTAHG